MSPTADGAAGEAAAGAATDGVATAAAVKQSVVALGGGFMTSTEAKNDGRAAGFRGWQYYTLGRGGALGDVEPDVVAAALGFFPADVVRSNWESARSVLSPAAGLTAYVGTARTWGRNRLEGLPGAARLAELLQRVAEAAPVAAVPLFAGWRSVALPEDAPARVAQLAQVLREHRGGLHLLAVLACGLNPLEAILAGPLGRPNATFFGWVEPFPEVGEEHRERWARADTLTDELAAPAYAVLTADEAAELERLLAAAVAHVDGRPDPPT